MHVKHDYSHREGERYTALEQLHLLLALETNTKQAVGESGQNRGQRSSECCCLIACQDCERCSSSSSSTSNQENISKLHTAILEASQRCAEESASSVTCQLQKCVEDGCQINCLDSRGETALCYVKLLLDRGRFSLAYHVTEFLLTRGAYVDAEDSAKQTLLSHSVSHLDPCIDLTRLLLNHGADVWNGTDFSSNKGSSVHYAESPFSSFLEAVVRCHSLDRARLTAGLLGRVMGAQPEAMRSVVMRSMIRHGRHIRVLGPVFVQLKSMLSGHWRQPQRLQYGAWKAVRKAVGPKRLGNNRGLKQLGLPPSIIRFLTMED